MSRRGEARRRRTPARIIWRRQFRRVYESDWMQNAEEVQENTRQEMNFHDDHSITLQELLTMNHHTNARIMDAAQEVCHVMKMTLEVITNRFCQETSDIEKETMRRQANFAILKAKLTEVELNILRRLEEAEAAEIEKKIKEMEERQNILQSVLNEYLSEKSGPVGDGNNDDDDPAEEEDITEHASWYCTAGRELTENRRNPYRESQERVVRRSESAGTSSWLPGVAATSGNNEATICGGGTSSSTTMPHAASMSNGRVDDQSEMCPICLCGFVTQEIGTPEACNHSFCVDCLQEWLKNTNTCPIDRQVCDTILVRHYLGGKVVRKIHMEPPRQQQEHDVIDYFVRCGVCGDDNRISALINCDRCGRSYHLDCIYPRLDSVPLGEWFCSDCS
ncbi:PHD and RING finger domain-containing protein 1-like [Cryptotermes secundus]|uniref:PHD and RING finger domain-containing protein 1-like n=1 Tax=Cryptotermes secundus TaxID=105785 RepID=UPI000CD7CAA2|nr:PHD and RING finger domain-containing protein 1-like [Cryptotermes secundus]